MVEKHNSLIIINYGTYFIFWDITFKVCNNACIIPSFGKIINFYSVFLKRTILLILKITFCKILVVIKPKNPFKVYNTDCIMPGFDKQFIFNKFSWLFKVKLFR